jgi:hypothetical protein
MYHVPSERRLFVSPVFILEICLQFKSDSNLPFSLCRQFGDAETWCVCKPGFNGTRCEHSVIDANTGNNNMGIGGHFLRPADFDGKFWAGRKLWKILLDYVEMNIWTGFSRNIGKIEIFMK